MAKTKNKRKTLVRKLDTEFSRYIRLRDADKFGYCTCITCGKKLHWKECHAGHFQTRGKTATRWEEYNVNVQCPFCNTYRYGEQYRHGVEIDLKFGKGTAKMLEKKAQEVKRFTIKELEEMYKYYKGQAKELEKIKG